jgi:hypothetical protein
LFKLGAGRELVKTADGRRPELGRVASDRGLPGALDARHATIQRRNQLPQLLHELGIDYVHDLTPGRVMLRRREAFQTSPQLRHRQ